MMRRRRTRSFRRRGYVGRRRASIRRRRPLRLRIGYRM